MYGHSLCMSCAFHRAGSHSTGQAHIPQGRLTFHRAGSHSTRQAHIPRDTKDIPILRLLYNMTHTHTHECNSCQGSYHTPQLIEV
jgi:hypothetical protein